MGKLSLLSHVNHFSWVASLILIDRPKSIRNRLGDNTYTCEAQIIGRDSQFFG